MALRRQRGSTLDAWPGYVDALSTLLMVLIFVLLVFVLAQGFLSVALSSRDRALDRLNRQVAELAEMLALERGTATELRATLGRTADELRGTAAARDMLAVLVREAQAARDAAGRERDTATGERDRLTARIADLELAGRGGADRLSAFEAQLADALSRAEAAGGDAAQTVRRLTETGRTLAAEQAARRRTEAEVTALGREAAEVRRELEEARRLLAAARAEAAALERTVSADRATLEARLAELARLAEEVRALTVLRDRLEREVADAAARQRATETALAEQARRGDAAREEVAALSRRLEESAAEQRALVAEGDAARMQVATLSRELEESASRQRSSAADAAEQTQQGDIARAQALLLTRQLDDLRAQMARLSAALDLAEAEGRDRDAQIVNLGARLNAALAARVEELQRYRSDFFGQLRAVLGERPEVRIVGDRFVFQSEVLFPAASAELSDRGIAQIRAIARVLGDIAGRIPPGVAWVLRVDGHADRAPIRSARFASNWELSSARAIAVAQLLIAEGLPANRVAATAFADNLPIDLADTPEAYARNRRIELRLTDR